MVSVLAARGYAPRADGNGDGVVLANCPFHALATEFTELVCGMNLRLLQGLTDEIGPRLALEPRLDPQPGRCCVRFGPPEQPGPDSPT